MNTPIYYFELLNSEHHRNDFRCGEKELDRYLQQQASQDSKRNLSVTYVLHSAERPQEIIGYYALSTTSLRMTDLPESLAKKLPRYLSLPGLLIGRLAVSTQHQGNGFGGQLLIDALDRCVQISKTVGSMAVIVNAINEKAMQFYKNYGFINFIDQPNHLYLPIKTIQQIFPRSSQNRKIKENEPV